jgi:HNH endonuclease
VRQNGDDGCWNFTGAMRQGHGVITRHGKSIYVHRFVFEMVIGPIPEGLCVRHMCDTRSCVNPEHLGIGNQSDNMRDFIATGRHRGTRGKVLGRTNKQDKLSPSTVDEMRRLARHGGMSQAAIGALYGVSQSVAGDAICGHTFKDATEPPVSRRQWGPGKPLAEERLSK